MASLREIRKALQGLLPTCLIDIVEEYIPHVELTFRHCLRSIAQTPIVKFIDRGNWIEVFPYPKDDYGNDEYFVYKQQAFSRFTIDFSRCCYPIFPGRVYSVEFDPILKTIVSVNEQ
jgi:hypothetical protein